MVRIPTFKQYMEPLRNFNNCDKMLREFEVKQNIPTDFIVNNEKSKNDINAKTHDKRLKLVGTNSLKIEFINNDKKPNLT